MAYYTYAVLAAGLFLLTSNRSMLGLLSGVQLLVLSLLIGSESMGKDAPQVGFWLIIIGFISILIGITLLSRMATLRKGISMNQIKGLKK